MMEGEVNLFEVARSLVQWIVIPVGGFVWLMYRTQQDHSTKLAVLEAVSEANKQAHDREFKQLQDNFKTVLTKLDNIEQALRK